MSVKREISAGRSGGPTKGISVGSASLQPCANIKKGVRCVHLVESLDVKLAELFDVDGATVLVCLVVVLGVVLINLLLFRIFKRVVELVDLELGSPLFSLGEHGFSSGEVPFASTEEAAQARVVVSFRVEDALLLDGGAELVKRLFLGSVEIAWAAALCGVGHWCLCLWILLASLRGVFVVFAEHSLARNTMSQTVWQNLAQSRARSESYCRCQNRL